MSFYEEVAKMQLYSDKLVAEFKEQISDVFTKLIVPKIKKSIQLSVIVGLNNTKYNEYLYITGLTDSKKELNTILLNLPLDLAFRYAMKKRYPLTFTVLALGIIWGIVDFDEWRLKNRCRKW